MSNRNLDENADYIESMVKVNVLGPMLVSQANASRHFMSLTDNLCFVCFQDDEVLFGADERARKWPHC